ncbi:MAG: hypothetical protein CLLPBCKN_006792 [Chroococcidiopsis cubana SAG 39.79]|nr:hypothetical protein [Chroococcidiopsis cubana SAG 39.79]
MPGLPLLLVLSASKTRSAKLKWIATARIAENENNLDREPKSLPELVANAEVKLQRPNGIV